MFNIHKEWFNRVFLTEPISEQYFNDLEVVAKSIGKNVSILAVIIDDRKSGDIVKIINDFLASQHVEGVLHFGQCVNNVFLNYENINKYHNHPLPYKIKGGHSYNKLFMKSGFWKAFVNFQKVIVFQHDVRLLKPWSEFDLSWLDFDYIGAEWDVSRPNGKNILGGCGGFSIRNPRVHYEICCRFSGRLWLGGEDGFFAHYTDKVGGKVANMTEAKEFCCQFEENISSFAIHKPNI